MDRCTRESPLLTAARRLLEALSHGTVTVPLTVFQALAGVQDAVACHDEDVRRLLKSPPLGTGYNLVHVEAWDDENQMQVGTAHCIGRYRTLYEAEAAFDRDPAGAEPGELVITDDLGFRLRGKPVVTH